MTLGRVPGDRRRGDAKQRAAEILFRFAQGSIHRHGVFNGDPHPGNYRFHPDGTVTFLDFGLVKRWTPGELESAQRRASTRSWPATRMALIARDGAAPASCRPATALDPQSVFDYASAPYVPYLTDEFTFTPGVRRRRARAPSSTSTARIADVIARSSTCRRRS